MASNHIADYPMLQKVLESNEKIVYICGAGASMSLGRHKSSWGTWLNTGRNRLPPPLQTEFDTLVGFSSAHGLIEAASYLLKNLIAIGSYTDFMDETIGSLHPSDQTMMDAFRKICRAGDLIATTNYDQLIEEATGSGYVTYEKPGEILPVINGTAANRVIHLHGIYDKKELVDNIVADGEQYRTILENAGAQFIQNLLGTHPLIIVGCGGTVSDPNLSGFLQFVIKKLGMSVPYFYLMKEGDSMPSLPSNAVPICYGSKHDDFPPFLDELGSYRLRNRAEIKRLMLVDPYAAPKRLPSAFGRMHFANRFSDFTGRLSEQERMNRFLHAAGSILWWGVLGEGGIGKSRLILEWLRTLPANWYGFFAKKDAACFADFVPFTDTVIVLDYILGEEEQSAQTIAALMRQFEESPYRLRLLFVERRQDNDTEDWLAKLNKLLPLEDRFLFESCRYLNDAVSADKAELMSLKPFNDEDELRYIQNYLKAYVPVFLEPKDAAEYLTDLDTVGKTIQAVYRDVVEAPYQRPLYLSIFTEVWINRAGAADIKGVKQLLRVYLEKETDRWKALLKEDRLVNSYLKLLAMACVTEQFNITDVQGNNYLQKDCDDISAFLDEQDSYPGKQSIFDDLFVKQDELEEYDSEDSLLSEIYDQLSHDEPSAQDEDPMQNVDLPRNEKLSQDEKFAFLAPYVKLDADPEEFYLLLLQGAGGLSEEEAVRLTELREERIRRIEALPDYAWILVPAFPDIIKEYLVLHILKVRDIIPFTKLARANSVYGLGQFLTRAIEDWPDEPAFWKIMAMPPENVLEYFEFYIPWLAKAREITDFTPVENIMLQGEATLPFARFEMELWSRIASVLTEQENWDRLLDSSKRFVQYASEEYDHPMVRKRIAETLDAYAVGFHNAAEAEKLELFLNRCDDLARTHQDDPQLALLCCDNRGRLIHLRCYLEHTEPIQRDWNVIVEHLSSHLKDRDICLSAIGAANEYYKWLRGERKEIYQRTKELAALLESVFEDHPVLEVAELLAIVTANLYMLTLEKLHEYSKGLFQRIQHIFAQFPGSKRIRSAYASACGQQYARGSIRAYDVPCKIMERLKKWSSQYPDEIEFQEAYFCVMLVHMEYAQDHGFHAEAMRSFRELERIAKAANYDEYNEENRLQTHVDLLRKLFTHYSNP